MKILGEIACASSQYITLKIDGDSDILQRVEGLKNKPLTVELKKYYPNKSNSANGYFWHIIKLISEALGTGKTEIYIHMLKEAGQFVNLIVPRDSVSVLERTFRVVEIIGQSDDMVEVLAYYGISTYNSKDMAIITEYAKREALEMGLDVDDDIRRFYESI